MAPPSDTLATDRPENDPRPVVALPRPATPGAVIAVVGAVLAVILFLVLENRRKHPLVTSVPTEIGASDSFHAPPPLALPPEPAPAAPILSPPAISSPRPMPGAHFEAMPPVRYAPMPPQETAPMRQQVSTPSSPASGSSAARSDEQALVFDEGPVEAGQARARPATGEAVTAAAAGEDAPTRTAVIANRSTIMATGTMIPAVLETPIDSSRPGLIRAVVSEDARGFDGRNVLVPRGSRLIGEYQSDVRSGQHRVLVNWTRLIRPDGVTIRIGSPAADAMGGAGVPGRVNSFFFERFAGAALQSALAVGVNLASRPGNGSVIVGYPGALAGSVGQNLVPSNDLQPKITVKQGAVVNVFVAHDLDFSGAPMPRRDRAQ